MSLIIKGMNMPKSCFKCQIYCKEFIDSAVSDNDFFTKRLENCPLVEFSEKQGRLIDADAFVEYLENEFKSGYENDQKSDADMKMLIAKMHELIITEIRKRPTVIESEECK